MYKRSIVVGVVVGLFSAVNVNAQDGVKVEYDEFTGVTTVGLSTVVQADDGSERELLFYVNPLYDGRMITFFFATGGRDWQYRNCSFTDWLLNGERYEFEDPVYEGEVAPGGRRVTEFLSWTVAVRRFDEMAKATSIRLQICGDTYALSSVDLRWMREFLEQVNALVVPVADTMSGVEGTLRRMRNDLADKRLRVLPYADVSGTYVVEPARLIPAALRSVLRSLMIVEESYYADHATYTADLGELNLRSVASVNVVILSADSLGFSARASSSLGGPVCVVERGSEGPVCQ